MEAKYKNQQLEQKKQQDSADDPTAFSDPSDDDGADGEVEEDDEQRNEEMVKRTAMLVEDVPSFDADQPEAAAGDSWTNLSLEERASAAGPAPAADDRTRDPNAVRANPAWIGQVNPVGYDWESRNFVSQAEGRRAFDLWGRWRNSETCLLYTSPSPRD